jgi:hypothetical protein
MNITINILEVASELAHQRLVEDWASIGNSGTPLYNGENYCEDAQDIFNDYYDNYYLILESANETNKR